MTERSGITVRFLGDEEAMRELAELLQDQVLVENLSLENVEAGPGADFDFDQIMTLISTINPLLFNGALVPAIWNILRKRAKKAEAAEAFVGSEIVVQTPTKSARICWSGDLSQDDIRDILAKLIK
ncbi:MAG: hypothetical protein ACXW36_11170 [Nitrospira sp.]